MDKTLLKGLRVLEHVAASDETVRITDVSTALGLTKSNAHRVLKTLEAAGYLRQNQRTREYVPSLKLWEIGSGIVGRLDIRQHSSDILRKLANQARATASLSVLEGLEIIYIEKIDSPDHIGIYTRVGGRAPAYCVATGKALLSMLDRARVEPMLAGLVRHTKNTIVEPEQILADLAVTRERGYAVSRAEWREGVWAIASAIRGSSGEAVAAIGISSPEYHLIEQERCEAVGKMVAEAAKEVSHNIGFRA